MMPNSTSAILYIGPYHTFTLEKADPAILHMTLLATMLSVFDHCSFTTLGWLLKSGKGLLTLAASGGLGKPRAQTLSFFQAETLKGLPIDIQTAF